MATDGQLAGMTVDRGGGVATVGYGDGISDSSGAMFQVKGSANLAGGALLVDADSGLKLADYTTIASPVEGQIAWNYTNHTQVVSENSLQNLSARSWLCQNRRPKLKQGRPAPLSLALRA
jgi:hypothetical protein